MLDRGDLPAVRVGTRGVRILRSDLDAFIGERKRLTQRSDQRVAFDDAMGAASKALRGKDSAATAAALRSLGTHSPSLARSTRARARSARWPATLRLPSDGGAASRRAACVPESFAEGSTDALKLRCRGADPLAMGTEASGNTRGRIEPDRCMVCGKELAAVDQAIRDPVTRTVTCTSCHPDVPVVEGKAGASARREYQRRHERRELHARKRLGGLGTVLARVIDEPQSTKSWQQGALGEERTAARLAKHLEGHDVKVLHDRRVPGHGQANIDHLVVGAGGVTVIDSKTHKGEIRVDRVGGLFSDRHSILLIGGRDRTSLIDGLERQIEIVRSALARGRAQDVDVRGALCFPNPDGLPLFKKLTIRDIVINGTKPVAKLARRVGPLDHHRVEEIWRQLAAAFPPA